MYNVKQTTNRVLMIRPTCFTLNQQTATDNVFQKGGNSENVQGRALKEFNDFVQKLNELGVTTKVFNTEREDTPDSIFPNNWISLDRNLITLYPMKAENRRLERREDIVEHFKNKDVQVFDLSGWEEQGKYLEGTGSLIFDRPNNVAYMCVSERSNVEVAQVLCKKIGYELISFSSFSNDRGRKVPVYHTNVVMSLGENLAVICSQSILNEEEREKVMSSIAKTGRKIVDISTQQMHCFLGNVLQIENSKSEKILVISDTSYKCLEESQKRVLQETNQHLAVVSIPTIEVFGGGSVRCCLAEIFLSV